MPLTLDEAPAPVQWLYAAPELDAGHGALLARVRVCEEGPYTYFENGREVIELNTRDACLQMAEHVARAPLTREHPEHPDGVTPETWATLSIGDADGTAIVREEEVVRDGRPVVVDGSAYKRVVVELPVALRRTDAVGDAVTYRATGRTVGASPGYESVRDNTPGVHPVWGRYDRRRVGVATANHLAILFDSEARGGERCRVALDGVPRRDPPPAQDADPPPSDPEQGQETDMNFSDLMALIKAASMEERAAMYAALMADMPEDADKPDASEMPEEMASMDAAIKAQDARLKALEARATAQDAARDADGVKALRDLAVRFKVADAATAAPPALVSGLAARLDLAIDGIPTDAARQVVERTAAARLARAPHVYPLATATDAGETVPAPTVVA